MDRLLFAVNMKVLRAWVLQHPSCQGVVTLFACSTYESTSMGVATSFMPGCKGVVTLFPCASQALLDFKTRIKKVMGPA